VNVGTEGYAAVDCDTTPDPVSCWSPDGTLFGVGMVFGACLGADDNVEIALTVDLLGELLPGRGHCMTIMDHAHMLFYSLIIPPALSYLYPVGSTKYDAAMYINLDGGSAISGNECAIVPMVAGTYGDVTIAETDGDGCPDFSSSGQLTDFPFDTITLACADNDGNGKLDFDVAVSWDQSADANCAMDGSYALPAPGTKAKCWKPSTGVRFE
jgi:hypothetical protein